MLKFGKEPFLECSSKGDRRFSAFYARVKGKSIEEQYQAAKIIDGRKGLSWREAKGKIASNADECKALYSALWDYYFYVERPELLEVIKEYKGFSDIFGQPGHACQAEEIYRIWKKNVPSNESKTA